MIMYRGGIGIYTSSNVAWVRFESSIVLYSAKMVNRCRFESCRYDSSLLRRYSIKNFKKVLTSGMTMSYIIYVFENNMPRTDRGGKKKPLPMVVNRTVMDCKSVLED